MPSRHRVTKSLRRLSAALVAAVTGVALAPAFAAPAQADRVTPGNFTGFGFDQCVAPESWKMDRWMEYSPFMAVGIYISGDSRACRDQPNLSKEWVEHQVKNRWRLLPITLGPQASCLDRFPRYEDDRTISPRARNNYGRARRQGRREATKAVRAAEGYGIAPGSTLWYDLEGFNVGNRRCRESALRFLHAWTNRIHKLDYVSGVYSSAGSGIKMLDQVRMERPDLITLPDRLWIARWDGKANLDACFDQVECYIRPEGWQPHRRVKQYLGGHNETWGGVTINIDSNYMSLGKGSSLRKGGMHCGSVSVDLPRYRFIFAKRARSEDVKPLQCLLRKHDYYDGPISGNYNRRLVAAVRQFQADQGVKVVDNWTRRNWTQLLSKGYQRTIKTGSAAAVVRRYQRALTAATRRTVPVTGAFDARTREVTKYWQSNVNEDPTGVVNRDDWRKLKSGRQA